MQRLSPSKWTAQLQQILTLWESKPIKYSIICLLIVILIKVIIIPIWSVNSDLDKQIIQSKEELKDVSDLYYQYEAIKNNHNETPINKAKNLFAYIESLTSQTGLSNNVDFIRPGQRQKENGTKEEEVFLRFTNLIQRDFIKFLHATELEHSVAKIRELRIKENRNKRLDIDLVFFRTIGE